MTWREVFDAHGVELPVERFALRIGTLTGPDELDELDALLDAPCDREAVDARTARPRARAARAGAASSRCRRLPRGRRARGIRVGIVSSSSRSWVDRNLRRLGLADGWAAIICADGDTTRCKPSPALYLEALDALGVDADEAIAIEDSPNGITAARAAGMFCVAVPNDVTARPRPLACRPVVESFEDVPLARAARARA